MSLYRSAAIAGVAESRLGIVPDATVLDLQAEAAIAALADAGVEKSEVDALFCTGRWGRTPQLEIGEYLGIRPFYSDGTAVGGASFLFHLGHAAAAISAGLCDVALILYGSTQRSRKERSLGVKQGLSGQYEDFAGLPNPVGAYALAACRHMALYGTTREQLAEVAVAARQWAGLNPVAFSRAPLTVEAVLASPPVAEPLGRLDCCLVTDGGGAVVIVSPRRAKTLPKRPVWLLGHGETHSHMLISQMPDLTVTPAKEAGARAFAMAGLAHRDIDILQIYDSFTITVLLTLESLGFCAPGSSGTYVSDGRIAPGGEVSLNTSGGGLSYCHPGMFGIFLIIEAVRQLRGECGARQVGRHETALISGTGGVLSSNATCILAGD
ncbi:acetyl-CoA acetyltransferase [Aquabacter spiritensis]|uniref:Acetyl-CoA acetyltransferase n=1 Tax=Aquabacter spiritensis TaxID=933073 RepID=A0A4R3LV98_9HYPH|nr:acetyl-CoA acetyltransferase [Aquabacter spiritensis]TCT03589.1 acetyl-CoA acetyltransferase [Aquabacter spiritensis]